MRIMIIGAGAVGYHLAHRLSEEHQDVVVVEADPDRARMIEEQLDVMTVVGNGASLPILQQAGIARARLILAVTSRDEVNVLCCLAAARVICVGERSALGISATSSTRASKSSISTPVSPTWTGTRWMCWCSR